MKKRLATSFLSFLLLTISSALLAQEKSSTDLKDFKLLIEKTDNGIKMKSFKGSAWIDLSFSIANGKPQAIDEYGMTKLDKASPTKDLDLADYLFTITKTKSEIILKGIDGTAWMELSFSLSGTGKQMIDQFGMTE